LTAHELTHVVQQTGSSINSSIQRECGVDESCLEEPNASYPEPNYAPVSQEPNASYPEPNYTPVSQEPNASYPEPNYTPVSQEPNASYPEPNYTPVSQEPNASYPEPNALPVMSDPSASSPTTVTPPSSQGNGWEFFNNPIWNAVTNNAVSGATGLFEAVNPIMINMPTFRDSLIRLGGMRGWDAALKMEDALSLPASRLPGGFGQSGSIVGSRLPMGMSRASAALAPLGVVSNAMSFYDAIARPNGSPGSSGLERIGDATSSAAGFFSSAVGTTALAGAGLEAAGATTLGGTLSAGAAGFGPAAAVAGSGAGGYAAGRLIDEGVGGLMNLTGASGALDRWRGITRPEGQHGDYSISGMGADVATTLDQGFTSMMRYTGAYDESRPAYTQTLGWWLADKLPSWIQ
jgi:hypothetical protein